MTQIGEAFHLAPPAYDCIEDEATQETQHCDDHQAGDQDGGRETGDQPRLRISDGQRDRGAEQMRHAAYQGADRMREAGSHAQDSIIQNIQQHPFVVAAIGLTSPCNF
mgnify:CR=1 FL=1